MDFIAVGDFPNLNISFLFYPVTSNSLTFFKRLKI